MLLKSFVQYWLFFSAFATIYVIFDATIGSINGLKGLYLSWEDCLILSTGGQAITPVIQCLVVLILALLFLRYQRTTSFVDQAFGSKVEM